MDTAGPRLILASGSARRRDLLAQIGLVPHAILAADIDETPLAGELARALACRLARQKASAVAADAAPGEVVLAADTVVACGRRILGKAQDEAEARTFLSLLSGRRHRVVTALCVRTGAGGGGERMVESRVAFKRLTAAEIDSYIASREWQGKAGAYAIQGHAGVFVRWLEGSYTNIVGLPLYETAALLEAQGFRVFAPGPGA